MSELDQNRIDDIEQGERWLATLATPAPSADCQARVRQAVHAELRRRQSCTTQQRWSPTTGIFAAAAAIALAVGVGWYAKQSMPPDSAAPQIAARSPSPSYKDTGIAISVDTGGVAEADGEPSLAMSSQLDDNLKTLEEWSKDSTWDLTGSSLSAALDEVYSMPVSKGTGHNGKSTQG